MTGFSILPARRMSRSQAWVSMVYFIHTRDSPCQNLRFTSSVPRASQSTASLAPWGGARPSRCSPTWPSPASLTVATRWRRSSGRNSISLGARASLRRTLVTLNQAGEKRWLDTGEDRISLPDQPGLWVDARRFHDLLADVAGHRHAEPELCEECVAALTEAAALYSDAFLAGFSLADAPEFDAWQTFQAESLQRSLAGALERLARAHAHAGRRRLDLAIDHARRWLSLDPLHEPAHRLLMQLYAQAGDRTAALQQYDQCVRTLQAELGVPPEAETLALYEEIRAGTFADRAPGDRETMLSLAPAGDAGERHNLPAPATPFVGRAAELAQIAERLADPECRLLTVLGPGGIGKTRLAVKAAQTQAAHFQDGVWFVDLAAVAAPSDVAGAIARALDAPSSPAGEPLQHLVAWLRPRPLLLLLDNFEHLLAGVDLLPTLLQRAPQLKLLVTSRERLNLSEEWLLPLEGLDVPPPVVSSMAETSGAAPEEPDLSAYDATKLFLRCVSRVKPGFQPTTGEAHHIVEILSCARRNAVGHRAGGGLGAFALPGRDCRRPAPRD